MSVMPVTIDGRITRQALRSEKSRCPALAVEVGVAVELISNRVLHCESWYEKPIPPRTRRNQEFKYIRSLGVLSALGGIHFAVLKNPNTA